MDDPGLLRVRSSLATIRFKKGESPGPGFEPAALVRSGQKSEVEATSPGSTVEGSVRHGLPRGVDDCAVQIHPHGNLEIDFDRVARRELHPGVGATVPHHRPGTGRDSIHARAPGFIADPGASEPMVSVAPEVAPLPRAGRSIGCIAHADLNGGERGIDGWKRSRLPR